MVTNFLTLPKSQNSLLVSGHIHVLNWQIRPGLQSLSTKQFASIVPKKNNKIYKHKTNFKIKKKKQQKREEINKPEISKIAIKIRSIVGSLSGWKML